MKRTFAAWMSEIFKTVLAFNYLGRFVAALDRARGAQPSIRGKISDTLARTHDNSSASLRLSGHCEALSIQLSLCYHLRFRHRKHKTNNMLPSSSIFLDQVFTALEPEPDALAHLLLDHACYRVASVARYEELADRIGAENELLVESVINGRRIATFRLAAPLRFREREIWLLELPEPKTGSPYPEGWEHVEFVTDRPLAAFAEWLTTELGIAPEDIDRSGMGKTINADLRLRLPGGLSVKFHELPLDEVIRRELGGE